MKQCTLLIVLFCFLFTVSAQTKTDNQLTKAEKKEGWQLLFDGVSNKGWSWAGKSGFPGEGWIIKDGAISVEPVTGKGEFGSLDIISDKQYSAFELVFDFNVSPGGNSGLKYFVSLDYHNTPLGLEYQVLDDSLHPDAKAGRDGNRTMASLYDLIKADKKPAFIHPPGNWNTGKIIVYPNNHVEHYLNGIKVLEYDRGSQAFKDLIAQSKYKDYPNFGLVKQGYILLQYHGNKASFKNIRIKELK